MKPCVLILFGNNTLAYNLADSLIEECEVVAFVPKDLKVPFKGSNKFSNLEISRFRKEDPNYIKELLTFGRSKCSNQKILTFLCNDLAIEFWIKHQELLNEYFSIGYDNLIEVYDKNRLYDFVPEKLLPRRFLDEKKIVFPVIVKPLGKGGGVKSFSSIFRIKAVELNSIKELQEFRKKYPYPILFQEVIPFEEGDEYSFLGVFSANGFKGLTFQHKTKYPNKEGRLTSLILDEKNSLREYVEEVYKQTDYKGIIDLQFLKHSLRNQFYLLEINPRYTSGREVLSANGIPWEKEWVQEYYNETVEFSEPKALNGVNWYSSLYLFNKFFKGLLLGREFRRITKDRFLVTLKLFIFVQLKRVIYLKEILWRT